MKNQKYSKTVKDWFENFIFCYGKPTVKKEAESFYSAGFDDGAVCMCNAMREAGIPVTKISEIFASLDPKRESITYQTITEDWLEDDVDAVVPKQQYGR